MEKSERTLPVDQFSRRFRELSDNPGAVRAGSTFNLIDFYGQTESWIVDTFRLDGGSEEVFLQRVNAEGSIRLLLPPEVTASMARQRDRGITATRRRGARQAVATKRAAGTPIGNIEALRKARKRGKK